MKCDLREKSEKEVKEVKVCIVKVVKVGVKLNTIKHNAGCRVIQLTDGTIS